MIDEKEFFQVATLKICSSLEADRFLHDSFMYIRKYIPADFLCLTHYYPETRTQLVLAAASDIDISVSGMKIDIPQEIHRSLVTTGDRIVITDCAKNFLPALPWIKKGLLSEDSSILILRLLIDDEILGSVIFISQQNGVYNDEHARLLNLLKEPFAVAFSNSLRFKELIELKNRLSEESRFFQDELQKMSGGEIVGATQGLSGVMEMVRQVSGLNSPVLILGETGTGKELIAGTIHRLSKKSSGPFVKVNCGAIPDNLIDSELFGHEKGAFTGALSLKRGRFERADGGTIFLDEVGELRLDAQVRLLRVLQEKEIERVGGTGPVRLNIRIIAATHRNLEALVQEGRFRQDLYFRLKVFPVMLPPLRERTEDIPVLLQYLIQKKTAEMGLGKVVSPDPGEIDKLLTYSWPGNIRELENMVEKALILSHGNRLIFDEPVLNDNEMGISESAHIVHKINLNTNTYASLDDVIKNHIMLIMKKTKGKVGGENGAAALLRINPSTLRKRMHKLGIPFGRKAGRWA